MFESLDYWYTMRLFQKYREQDTLNKIILDRTDEIASIPFTKRL